MFAQMVDWVSGSNWSYVAIFAVALLDAFFPIVPSETAVITGGVVAELGRPLASVRDPLRELPARSSATTSRTGSAPGSASTRSSASSAGRSPARHSSGPRRQLEARGFYLIIVARFIPGGRTAVTFSSGYTHGHELPALRARPTRSPRRIWGNVRGAARLHRREAVRGRSRGRACCSRSSSRSRSRGSSSSSATAAHGARRPTLGSRAGRGRCLSPGAGSPGPRFDTTWGTAATAVFAVTAGLLVLVLAETALPGEIPAVTVALAVGLAAGGLFRPDTVCRWPAGS